MHSLQITSAVVSLLAGQAWAATGLQCNNIVTGDQKFNLEKLGGPHSVVTTLYESIPQTHLNTTYTLDICQVLKKDGKAKKTEQCPNGTRVCAISRLISADTDNIEKVIAIAGSLEDNGGTKFEYDAALIPASEDDSQKPGLRLTLNGGRHPLDGPKNERRTQKAVIDFLCDEEKEGTEGEWDSEDKYEKVTNSRRDEDKGKGEGEGEGDGDEGESSLEHQLKKENAALIWESYGQEKDGEGDVLRLTWHTKYACGKRDGGSPNNDEESSSSHWGFFTWFVVIVFLAIAAYLIFGSWLNYNRYGARGWDLLPHGDTIRDIPYLLKDWTRRVLNTVQGAGSRGGYSAV